jgi:hypothetical protein
MQDRHNASQKGAALLQHFKPFAAHRGVVASKTSDCAAGMSEARNDPVTNRIANANKYDRDVPSERPQNSNGKIGECNHNVRRRREQFRHNGSYLVLSIFPPANISVQINSRFPSQLGKAKKQRRNVPLSLRRGCRTHQNCDTPRW